ncbi:MAG: radical SAM protein [Patescibacteria group bacterium]
MRVQTFSILAGSEACNARCPFCVSKMTPPMGIELKEPEVNWRNFRKACRLAQLTDVTTVMFTGKGEPTLFPKQITRFMDELARYDFPIIEIQTNGIPIAEKPEIYDQYLKEWYEKGLTTIAISIVHYDTEKNRQNYLPSKKSYIDLPALIKKLHDFKFSVRLTCIMVREGINGVAELERLVQFAKENKVEQLTVTPVNKPEETENEEVWHWTKENHLLPEQLKEIINYLEKNGSHLMTLSHGAKVYDLHGQNICLNYCLTVQPESETMRNIIFFPDGHPRPYWQYPATLF